MFIICIYQTTEGKKPFKNWLESIKDKLIISRIHARIARIEYGNFGDSKSVGLGIMELRLAFGSGYRIYYGVSQHKIIILLTGGDKSSQYSDIKTAQKYWNDYLRRIK